MLHQLAISVIVLHLHLHLNRKLPHKDNEDPCSPLST